MSGPGGNCTLVTDASYCAVTGAAGWACWCKADGLEPHHQGGVIRAVAVRDNHEAELVACLHGLNVALQYAPERQIMLQSDSMWALSVLHAELGFPDRRHASGKAVQEAPKKLTAGAGRIVGALRCLLLRYPSVPVCVRHVKGHRDREGGRHWVNAMCDNAARRYMLEARGGAHLAAIEKLADDVLRA